MPFTAPLSSDASHEAGGGASGSEVGISHEAGGVASNSEGGVVHSEALDDTVAAVIDAAMRDAEGCGE